MKKSLKKVNTALALYFAHCAVEATLKCVADPSDIAGCISATCCNVVEGTDMIERIKKDDSIPETVVPWLIKIYEVLAHEEASQAYDMICITLNGCAIYDRISDLECYDIL